MPQEEESWSLTEVDGKKTPPLSRPIPRKRPKPARQPVPPFPPHKEGGGGRRGGGGGRGVREVVFFVSPAIEGEHRIVVPIRQGGPGQFSGQWSAPVTSPSTTSESRNDEASGHRIEDAAFIKQPENLSLGCVFTLGEEWQSTVPRPIYYGEFLQSPVERTTGIYCSTLLYSPSGWADRYGGGGVDT